MGFFIDGPGNRNLPQCQLHQGTRLIRHASSKTRSLIHHAGITGVTLWLLLAASSAHAESVELILRNGDRLKGTLAKEESTDKITVLIHPNLGRIEIKTSALKPTRSHPWTGSVAAGINGNNTDQDLSAGGTVTLAAQYRQQKDTLTIKGQAQYQLSRDASERNNSIDTNQGHTELRYSRTLSERFYAYASNRYTYDSLNDVGTDTFNASTGLGVDLISTSTTVLNVSLGPAIQSIWGGKSCRSDETCGNTYAASSARTRLDWLPNKNIQLSLTNIFTGVAANGLKPINTFSVTLKIFPMSDKSFFTALNAQTIYDSLQSPQINNSISFQVGAQMN